MIPLGGEQARQTRFWAKICLTQSPTKLLFQIAYNEDSLCETKSGCRAAKENSGNQEYSILLTDIIALNSFQGETSLVAISEKNKGFGSPPQKLSIFLMLNDYISGIFSEHP